MFSTKSLQPNFGRLSPLQGLGRMFSMQTLAELLKAIAKSVLVGGVAAGCCGAGCPRPSR